MLTMTDLFCGAGGSSQGAISVPGVSIRVASNHWELAVETHNTNHQDADHICADLSQINPSYFPTTDLLWASPECTNHSPAKGKKRVTEADVMWGEQLPDEAAERSRATMWDVIRFTEYHQYRAILVENVTEAAKWVGYRGWRMTMDDLGYRCQVVALNSMHASAEGLPAPQSRDRGYWVFTRKGDRAPDLAGMQRPTGLCPSCMELVRAVQSWKKPENDMGRYRQQYVYRCPNVACKGQIVEPAWLSAETIIDWSLKGQRIGDRDRPLADKTRRRIGAGIARYWGPLTMEAAGSTYDTVSPTHPRHGDPDGYVRAWPTTEPIKTIHTTASKALVVPVEGRDGKVAKPASDPLRTQTARNESGLAFLTHLKGSADSQIAGSHSPVDEPIHTIAASGNHHALIQTYYGTSSKAKPVTEALDTVTATDRHALVMTNNHSNRSRPVQEPAPTVTTATTQALLMRNNSGGAEMVTPVTEVIRTLTTGGHQSVLTAGDIDAAMAQVDDVLFRMLEPAECKMAMAFTEDYVMLGTKRQQVRLAGNAVTPPAARDLVAAVVRALTGE